MKTRETMTNHNKLKDLSPGQNLPPEEAVTRKGKKTKKQEVNQYSLAIGRTLRRLREKKNLGQGEAALEANFSLSYLSNVERGNHAISLNKFMSFSDGVNSRPEEICQLLCEEIARCENANNNDSANEDINYDSNNNIEHDTDDQKVDKNRLK